MNNYNLHGRKKLEYIWDYYKLPIITGIIIFYIVGYFSYKFITKKNTLLSVATVNIEFSPENSLKLSDEYLKHKNLSNKRYNIDFFNNLMSEGNINDGTSYEYAYASSMKLLALMTDKALDVVIMDDRAYQTFSDNEYLYFLDHFELYKYITPKNNAICISSPYFSSDIYIGIIKNSQHIDESLRYIQYLINILSNS